MRNKTKIACALLAASLFLPVFVMAQNEIIPEQRTTADDGITKQRPEPVSATQAKTRQSRVENLKKLVQNQIDMAEKTIKRLDAIIAKIQRIQSRLKDEGADLTEVERLVAEAKTQKQEAERLLADLRTKAAALTPDSAEPKKAVQDFMKSANELKKQLRTLHKTLNDVVKALRKAEQAITNEQETE